MVSKEVLLYLLFEGVGMKIELDLDDVFTGDHWETTVGEIVRAEIRALVKLELKKAIRTDKKLRAAIKKLQDRAAEDIIAAL